MTAKKLNALLWMIAALFGVGAVVALLYGSLLPIDRSMSIGGSSILPATQAASSSKIPPPAAFDQIVHAIYRQPLGDPAPQVTLVPVPATTSPPGTLPGGLPVTLVGTVGNSLAMLKTLTNTVEVCGVGEVFKGVTVVAVRPSEVEVKFNGQNITLSTPSEK
jgi:hypothetical protein